MQNDYTDKMKNEAELNTGESINHGCVRYCLTAPNRVELINNCLWFLYGACSVCLIVLIFKS